AFFKPINFTAASFNTNAAESVANSLEKSRPSLNCQPTVLPYPYDILVAGKSTAKLGSLPFQSKWAYVLQTAVNGPTDSAISITASEFFNSSLTASKWL